MRGGPRHIFHFIGHGGFDRNADQGLIALADEDGLSALMHATELGRLLADHDSLRLVLLNSCEGARGGEQDIFSSTASILVRRGIPAVVAMQYAITDRAAIEFSRAFYEALADGLPVDAAVSEARKAISLAVANTIEWGTPVLYMRSPQGIIFQMPDSRSTRPPIPRRPPDVDTELERRLEPLYTEGLAAFWVEDWDKACRSFQAIVDARPDFADAKTKLEQAKRQERLSTLYAQAQAAQAAQDWQGALGALETLVTEAGDYKDASALLKSARQQKQLADLYAEARRLHQAQQWQAVVNVFAQITATQPDYADPDGLLPTAEREVAALKRKAELDALYSRAVRAMDAGRWQEAQKLLKQVKEQEPAFRETERLLARTEAELAHEQQERQRQEQIATLYEQAIGLARARQWRQALAKMQEIYKLDAQFDDPDKISARAQEEVAREEQEAQRQNEIAASYAEAVRLLRDGQYQKALEKWAEVQARDPKYPDRQHVQSIAKKKLDALAQAAPGKRRVSKRTLAAIGGVGLIALVVAIALSSRLSGGAAPAVISTFTPAPPSPAPMLTETIDADPTMYDNFNNPAYDGDYDRSRWNKWTNDPTSKIAQQNGILAITVSSNSGEVNLFPRQYRNARLTDPTFFEVKLMQDPNQDGINGFECGVEVGWYTLCQIDVHPDGTQTLGCGGEFSGQTVEVAVKNITPGTWHVARIEINPNTLTFNYFIDGQKVGAYTPSRADEFKISEFHFNLGAGSRSGAFTGCFDDVRIGPIQP
jgi:tetratricopeptide (TPR) repeat protein